MTLITKADKEMTENGIADTLNELGKIYQNDSDLSELISNMEQGFRAKKNRLIRPLT